MSAVGDNEEIHFVLRVNAGLDRGGRTVTAVMQADWQNAAGTSLLKQFVGEVTSDGSLDSLVAKTPEIDLTAIIVSPVWISGYLRKPPGSQYQNARVYLDMAFSNSSGVPVTYRFADLAIHGGARYV